jgi:hypothetical protein
MTGFRNSASSNYPSGTEFAGSGTAGPDVANGVGAAADTGFGAAGQTIPVTPRSAPTSGGGASVSGPPSIFAGPPSIYNRPPTADRGARSTYDGPPSTFSGPTSIVGNSPSAPGSVAPRQRMSTEPHRWIGPPVTFARKRQRRRRVVAIVGITAATLMVIATGAALGLGVLGLGTSGAAPPRVSLTPTLVAPAVGDCFFGGWASAIDGDNSTVWAASDRVAASGCGASHAFEIVSIGQLPASATSAPSAPAATSATVRSVYAACSAAANNYLGGNWRLAYAWLGVAVPDPLAWSDGARWRACVLHPTSTWQGTPTLATTSLHDGLRGTRPAAITCFNTDNGSPKGCAGRHTDEVVGAFVAPAGDWPGADRVHDIDQAGCETQVAHYLGLASARAWHSTKLGWSWWPPTQEQWEIGNRMAICSAHAFTSDNLMTGSVKGIGNNDPAH